MIYDAAGEITNDSSYVYTYDPEGNLLYVDGGNAGGYVYDAFGRRVSQTDTSGTFEYLFDLSNHPITKLQSGGRVGGEVWFGRHFASNSGTEDNFMHADWLGAGRAWTDLNGNVTLECQALSFGDSLYCWGSGNNFDDVFASLKYNFDNSLYDSQTRQYNPLQGRWTIPDPARQYAVKRANPQTWNRYAYVGNNPLSYADPTGLDQSDCYTGDCGGSDDAGTGGGSGSGAGSVSDLGAVGIFFSGAYQGSFTMGQMIGWAAQQFWGSDAALFGTPIGYFANCYFYDEAGERCYPQGNPAVGLSFNPVGGGGGAANCTPLTKGCFNVPTAEQQCVGNFYNSRLGTAVQFASPLSLLPGWNPQFGQNLQEWGIAIVGKLGWSIRVRRDVGNNPTHHAQWNHNCRLNTGAWDQRGARNN